MDHDVEDQTRPPHDDGGVVQVFPGQPLLNKSEESCDDRDNSDDGGGVVHLPFSDLDDNSLRNDVDNLEDTTQSQDQPMI